MSRGTSTLCWLIWGCSSEPCSAGCPDTRASEDSAGRTPVQCSTSKRHCVGAAPLVDAIVLRKRCGGLPMTESTLSISLNELERAAEFVHTVVPPTPQYAWPKLRQRARVYRLGEAREPHSHQRFQSQRRADLSGSARQEIAGRSRGHLGYPRQSWSIDLPGGGTHRCCGGDLCACRELARSEFGHAHFRGEGRRDRQGFRRGEARRTAGRRRARVAFHTFIPPGSRGRRRELCPGVLSRGVGVGHGVCRCWDGIGNLRPDYRSRLARVEDGDRRCGTQSMPLPLRSRSPPGSRSRRQPPSPSRMGSRRAGPAPRRSK